MECDVECEVEWILLLGVDVGLAELWLADLAAEWLEEWLEE